MALGIVIMWQKKGQGKREKRASSSKKEIQSSQNCFINFESSKNKHYYIEQTTLTISWTKWV